MCASVWNDASPCLVSDVSTHTTGQLRDRQRSVRVCDCLCAHVCVHAWVCVCMCVSHGSWNGGGVSYWKDKKKRGGAVCEQKEVGCRESMKPAT